MNLSHPPHSQPPTGRRHSLASLKDSVIFGTLCGLFSAVSYTASNICLRSVSEVDPAWVSAIKAIPNVVLIAPWMFVRMARSQHILPPPRVLLALFSAGVFAQLFGNVMFQTALGTVGISLCVPLVLGTLILTSALLGKFFLKEVITTRLAVAMGILIVAICVLSSGADEAHQSMQAPGTAATDAASAWELIRGVAAACFAGFSYAVLGAVIRHGVSDTAPLSTTLVTVGLAGILAVGTLSYYTIGWSGMAATTSQQWWYMGWAGIWNAVAFLALVKALQLTTVTYVNSLNASQAAMAALAGVVFFKETPSHAMFIGVGLTVLGLVVMKRTRRESPKPAPLPIMEPVVPVSSPEVATEQNNR